MSCYAPTVAPLWQMNQATLEDLQWTNHDLTKQDLTNQDRAALKEPGEGF